MMGVPSPVFGVSRPPLSETTLEPHTCKELLEMLAYPVNWPTPKAIHLPDVSHALHAMPAQSPVDTEDSKNFVKPNPS